MITENSLRILLENNGIADAKQKLLANDIKKKIESYGYEVSDKGSDMIHYDRKKYYNWVQLTPIKGPIYQKYGTYVRVEINLNSGEAKLVSRDGREGKYSVPKELVELCRKFRHASQSNFRTTIGKYGNKTNEVDEELNRLVDKARGNKKLQYMIAKTKEEQHKAFNNYHLGKFNSPEEKEAAKKELHRLTEKLVELTGGLFVDNNYYATKRRRNLAKEHEKNTKIAELNKKQNLKEETITEGSHHAKYPPAINYKHVNNYLIKARKALKEGRLEEADKWAWEACLTMHEDEMQGPGVAADVNAYNIYHKQLRNIWNAIIAAKKANKENN